MPSPELTSPNVEPLNICEKGKPLLTLKNIAVRYRQSRNIFKKRIYTAIKDVSFDVYAGESLGIIGRNGAGKSTLLRIMGGVISPDAGKFTSHNATVALLALQAGFDLELDGKVNAILSGMLLGFSYQQVNQKLDSIIDFAELGEFINQPIKTYSTGMVTRLAFSVAHLLEPDVLLVDEVLAVGDAEFREKSLNAMREKLLSDQTIVLVSHDGATIKSLCNRAVWIENGITRMAGHPDEVVDAYETYICQYPPV